MNQRAWVFVGLAATICVVAASLFLITTRSEQDYAPVLESYRRGSDTQLISVTTFVGVGDELRQATAVETGDTIVLTIRFSGFAVIHGSLAAIFGIAALSKSTDRRGALAAIRHAAGDLDSATASVAVLALIGLEIVVTVGLLSPVAQVFAFVAFCFLAATGALVVRDLPRGGADCGCFGKQLGLRAPRLRLIRHFVFIGLAAAAVTTPPSGSPTQIAAGAVAGITIVLVGPLMEAALVVRRPPN